MVFQYACVDMSTNNLQHHYSDRYKINHNNHVASIRSFNSRSWKLGWNLLAGPTFLGQIGKANEDEKGVSSLPEPSYYNMEEEMLLFYEVLKYS